MAKYHHTDGCDSGISQTLGAHVFCLPVSKANTSLVRFCRLCSARKSGWCTVKCTLRDRKYLTIVIASIYQFHTLF